MANHPSSYPLAPSLQLMLCTCCSSFFICWVVQRDCTCICSQEVTDLIPGVHSRLESLARERASLTLQLTFILLDAVAYTHRAYLPFSVLSHSLLVGLHSPICLRATQERDRPYIHERPASLQPAVCHLEDSDPVEDPPSPKASQRSCRMRAWVSELHGG